MSGDDDEQPDDEVQDELEERAETSEDDEVTEREAAEQALMETGDSEAGSDLADEID